MLSVLTKLAMFLMHEIIRPLLPLFYECHHVFVYVLDARSITIICYCRKVYHSLRMLDHKLEGNSLGERVALGKLEALVQDKEFCEPCMRCYVSLASICLIAVGGLNCRERDSLSIYIVTTIEESFYR